jgi:hypothetical protein
MFNPPPLISSPFVPLLCSDEQQAAGVEKEQHQALPNFAMDHYLSQCRIAGPVQHTEQNRA